MSPSVESFASEAVTGPGGPAVPPFWGGRVAQRQEAASYAINSTVISTLAELVQRRASWLLYPHGAASCRATRPVLRTRSGHPDYSLREPD
jgi:hypothetical protein